MIPSPFLRKKAACRSNGMALIISLAMIVILSLSVVVFLLRSTSNLQVEAARSSRTTTDILAKSGAEYVKNLFVQEIVTNANSTVTEIGGVASYLPKLNAAMAPKRLLGPDVAPADPNFLNLVRQSIAAADPNASSDGADAPALNGRTVGTNIWSQPMLAAAGFSANQSPCWIYVTRSGGATNRLSSSVIGRFSYNVYNQGGLLDANAAGHPAGLGAAQLTALRGTVAGADLLQLPGMTPAAVNNFVAFRTPAATVAASYAACVAASASSGFLSTSVTNLVTKQAYDNNYFATRQDLLHYVRTKNTGLASALPYLTTFSRSVNAPSWGPYADVPALPVSYQGNAEAAVSANRNLPNVRFPGAASLVHYHDDGTAETYSVQANAPLLQRRFSLARLAWLTVTGPAAGISNRAIADCFGLAWNPGAARWDYVGSTGDGVTLQSSIEILAQVATEGREPNFFELLKAGILSGSLGAATQSMQENGVVVGPLSGKLGGTTLLSQQVEPGVEGATDLQLLRIGANIIDCQSAHNYPTILALSYTGVGADPGGTPMEVAGVKDLPCFYGLDAQSLCQWNAANLTNPPVTKEDLVFSPIFFNPHRARLTGPPTLAGPGAVTVSLTGTLNLNQLLSVSPSVIYQSAVGKALSGTFTVTSADLGGAFRATPSHFHTTGAATLGSLVSYATADHGDQDVASFLIQSLSTDKAASFPALGTGAYKSAGVNILPVKNYFQIANLKVFLRYHHPSGIDKTYAMFTGYEPLKTGTTAFTSGGFGFTTLQSAYFNLLSDPRTGRLGSSIAYTRAGIDDPPSPTPIPGNGGVKNRDPFNATKNGAPEIPYALWPQGGKTRDGAGIYTNMADPDGVFRPADGWLSDAANPYQNLGDAGRRPLLLFRPYVSTAELGYVFRDSPWKTLSFFDETTGDGALLDLFSPTDEPAVTAGKVHLNSAPAPVIAALVSGTGAEPDGTSGFTSAQSTAIAKAFASYAFDASGNAGPKSPLNRAQLPAFLSSAELASSGAGLDAVKYHREGIVRALADTTQTRTWNLLIDVVAQSGRLPGGASSSGGNFMVDGESHRWVSVAIDRYTGQIVDEQTEIIQQ